MIELTCNGERNKLESRLQGITPLDHQGGNSFFRFETILAPLDRQKLYYVIYKSLIEGGAGLKVSGVLMGIVAIVLGVLVLALPELIRWLIGVGLIVIGVLALIRR